MTQDSVVNAGPKVEITEPEALWYNQKKKFFGNLKVYHIASIIYSVAALAPVLLFVVNGKIPEGLPIYVAFLWALVVSMAYPVWSWLETLDFERWVRRFDEGTRKRERAYYALMRDHAKSFWAGLLAVYTIAGLWGVALKGIK